ncbi:MAG: YerC/YecD family TrpR-related protein [Christensenella sp.]
MPAFFLHREVLDLYHSKLKSKELNKLFGAIMSLESEEECYMFFEDLCTVAELTAISQRYKVAQMLKDKTTCHAIAEKTGASTATISRVNRCLNYGTGGYNKILERNEEQGE